MKKIFGMTLTIIASIIASTLALSAPSNQPVAAIVYGETSCAKVAYTTQPFILVLKTNDELLQSITECAKEAKLTSASITGLGQLHNPTLAYFTGVPNGKPSLTTLRGYFELAEVTGNITNNNNQYYTHVHGVLADKQFHGIAGHIIKGAVGLTAEITITPLPAPVQRAVNSKTGFGPITG